MKGFKEVDLQAAYKLLEGTEAIMVCTKGQKDGQYNVTPYGWFTTYDYDPVTKVLFSSDPTHQCAHNAKRTEEFAICVPKDSKDPVIFQCGEVSSPDADKFAQFNIKGEKASKIDVKVLTENSRAIIECKLTKVLKESTVELFLGEAVAAWEKE
ncbi:MAG: flavin reductase [Treponema sp.]|nr:flavin reductase [Candidatus Treponema equifaecale]